MSRAVEPSLPLQYRMSALNSLLFKRIFGDTRCESRLFPIITRAWSTNASPEDDSTDRATVSHCRGKEQRKIVRAAVVGAPNAGKSTLTNALIGHKVFPVSPKVHTTRQKALGVFSVDHTQVVLLDTPGIIPYAYGRRLKMSKELMTDARRSLMEAEAVLVVVDASNKRHRKQLPPEVLHTLKACTHLPRALVLNKVDLVRHKRLLLEVVDNITGVLDTMEEKGPQAVAEEALQEAESKGLLPSFDEVFMVSALSGDGVEEVKDYLVSTAKEGEWEFLASGVTDTPPLTQVEGIVREKLFLHLNKEIPYVIDQVNVMWEESEDGRLVILQHLTCQTQGQKSIVIGPGGRTIQSVTEEAQRDVEQALGRTVDLTLHVRHGKEK